MTQRVVFRPEAVVEVTEAYAWYEARRRGLGQDFAEALDITVASIAERPLSHRAVHGELRRAVMRRFPYAVYFRVLGQETLVVGVVHGHRDPRAWQSRG